MAESDVTNLEGILERIRTQAKEENFRVTQHAHQEMVVEDITLGDVLKAISTGQVLENYPEHKRGGCCLINGFAQKGHPVHIVCTTTGPVLIIVTVYKPKPHKWETPTQRRR